jgi:hypothetical protein
MPHISETGLCGLRAASKRITTWAADMGSRWQRLAVVRASGQRNELEHFFAGSVDRFELERRERDWTRWQSRDGSLLGR